MEHRKSRESQIGEWESGLRPRKIEKPADGREKETKGRPSQSGEAQKTKCDRSYSGRLPKHCQIRQCEICSTLTVGVAKALRLDARQKT